MTPNSPVSSPPRDRRWMVLAVLSLSVFLIIIDNSIVNIALPTLVRELGATMSQLQWIVDAYTLVFAGLLLAAGSLGDRIGRARALRIGLVIFGTLSAAAAWAGSPQQLIAARAAMGIGAALIFPATLAILINVFTEPRERARAVGVWAAVSGLSVAVGPVTGGWLLERYWWGSVLLVNVPLVLIALIAGHFVVPESRDPHVARLDAPGLILSITAVTAVVWAIIEAPSQGWTDWRTLGAFGLGAVLLGAFVACELRSRHPMLDISLFRELRFTAASLSIMVAFFALFGFIFMVTQYFQFVRGYGAFEAGVRTLPFALATAVAAPPAPRLANRFGTKVVVSFGLLLMGTGFLIASNVGLDSSYQHLVLAMVAMAAGLGLAAAPATQLIMDCLPPERAGVGSAVNDTTRELGGALGVAISGSLLASVYAPQIVERFRDTPMPQYAIDISKESVGAADFVATEAVKLYGPGAGAFIRDHAGRAFLDGFTMTSRVLAGVLFGGAVVVCAVLPGRGRRAQRAMTVEPVSNRAPSGAHVELGIEGAGLAMEPVER